MGGQTKKQQLLHSKVRKACGGDNCPTKEVALAGAQQSGLWQEYKLVPGVGVSSQDLGV